MGIRIGPITTRNPVFLAPMSGVSDEPFRVAAHKTGAGLVVSEMIASEELVNQRTDMVRRSAGHRKVDPFVIQLAGREEYWMGEGARIAQDLGADIIDINMGCPAREVTGALSGSALMRDLDHAERLISATVSAATVPVTLKMRLGWDDATINAPELARRAENVGVAMLTVHGRTRCQFYKGSADWTAIRRVREATTLPLIANGDCTSLEQLRDMLARSGADGAMIGRGCYGRPWLAGELAEKLTPGTGIAPLGLDEQFDIITTHYDDILSFYGRAHGVKIARKHLGWYVARWIEDGHVSQETGSGWRSALVREPDAGKVLARLERCFSELLGKARKAA
jgi:nifR3 family TIM-barrel protein